MKATNQMYKLEIDNDKQVIQGVKISDRKSFLDLRTIVEAEYLEGWKPTKKDIIKLIESSKDPELQKQVEKELYGK